MSWCIFNYIFGFLSITQRVTLANYSSLLHCSNIYTFWDFCFAALDAAFAKFPDIA